VTGATGPASSTSPFEVEYNLRIAWQETEEKRAVFHWNSELGFRGFEYADLKETSTFTLALDLADPASKLAFNLSQASTAERQYWSANGKSYHMTGPAMASDWSSTMGASEGFILELPAEQQADVDDGDQTPMGWQEICIIICVILGFVTVGLALMFLRNR
jgi:hypothetical protein